MDNLKTKCLWSQLSLAWGRSSRDLLAPCERPGAYRQRLGYHWYKFSPYIGYTFILLKRLHHFPTAENCSFYQTICLTHYSAWAHHSEVTHQPVQQCGSFIYISTDCGQQWISPAQINKIYMALAPQGNLSLIHCWFWFWDLTENKKYWTLTDSSLLLGAAFWALAQGRISITSLCFYNASW